MKLPTLFSPVKKFRFGPMEIVIICAVIAIAAIPFLINKFKNRKNNPKTEQDTLRATKQKTSKPVKYKEEYQGGPSYLLIFAIIFMFVGVIGCVAIFAFNEGVNVWILLPLAAVAIGALLLFLNSKQEED